jgi:ribosomal-protein-alanine N-acetyltransferase
MGRFTAGASTTACVINFSSLKRDAVEALTDLESAATPNPWTAQNLLDSFEASANCYLIEYQLDSIGYCVVQSVLDEAELLNIVIFKPFQSQGFGAEAIQKLKLELVESGAKSLFLEVRASNVIARALYEKVRFEVVNIRRHYYRVANQAAEDAFVMRCTL